MSGADSAEKDAPRGQACGCPIDRHYRSCRVATPGLFHDEGRVIPPDRGPR